MANVIEQLDTQVVALFADWSLFSTVLALGIVGFVLYPLIFPQEPDTHPLLLTRQSSAGAVRYRGESAAYRSPETPHGFPLRTGLNVKDPGAPRWATGKDGDLRDVWREVQRGGARLPDDKIVPKATISTVLGKEEVIDHDIQDLSKEIGIVGRHLNKAGVKKVAIYLPNSTEFLSTLFAASFYGVSPILLPYNIPAPKVYELIKSTGADGLVSAAGSLPLDDVAQECKSVRSITWVVEKSSRDLDWSLVPESAKSRLQVDVWHALVDDNKASASPDLPTAENGASPEDVVTVWQAADSSGFKSQIVTFTQKNLVSATAAQLTALPLRQRLVSTDLVLPADSFAHHFVLVQTLAALLTHCDLAINSVAAPGVDLALASGGVSPTVVIASAESLVKLHEQYNKAAGSPLQKIAKYSQIQALDAGRMPSKTAFFGFASPSLAGNASHKLRLIITSEREGAKSPVLLTQVLSDLRIFTYSRIVYALTTARVAGAVSQSNVFDYRQSPNTAHFGIPLSSVELKLVNENDAEVSSLEPRGQLVVSGPAVSGQEGRVKLAEFFRMRGDFTLAYA